MPLLPSSRRTALRAFAAIGGALAAGAGACGPEESVGSGATTAPARTSPAASASGGERRFGAEWESPAA
ncbi:hypothetical protein ACIGN6_17725 [Streptomyces sp. NPDC053792]|uniref:hypothetical protein n=1 Tax=Streptomyces sp. NPDC053792 TaxID=3365716 RepID=UPI0037D923B8